ncbi:MAG TPA: adenosylcobalamin-dependent ribonucleoside-diphosphate reductase, partial [Gammaproteobacteria bacterium]|nr:adenosylcobalamin-dependent ribonucleoside-diphosphate reductase [Gammaproteobacteria bacterium]
GRILAGAGTRHQVTLFNCFVMNIQEDSIFGIFEALKEGALTLQQGGGVGYDFSVLRPRGYFAKKTGISSSGPVSFMQIWDKMSEVLLSTSARRGAMMGVLRCDHPDIEEFVSAKADPYQLRHFNVSVLVSDDFMQAVKEDRDWPLVFPLSEEEAKQKLSSAEDLVPGMSTSEDLIYRRWSNTQTAVPCRVFKRIRARALWDKMIRSAYDYAEPGVLFENTINRMNNLWYGEHISATNPCGEIPLPPYGACNLGSLNLTQFVRAPFTAAATLDWQGIEQTVAIATRFQDNIVDISRYPLKTQRQEALATRRIGIGLTGLGDTFVMLGLRYGSPESLSTAQQIMKIIAQTTWLSSVELAKEKGSFPTYQAGAYCQGQFFTSLPEEIQKAVALHGMRNSHHNTIAPAGTISILAQNVSSGLEPIFSGQYERVVRTQQEELVKFKLQAYSLALWQKLQAAESLPPAWRDTESILPQDHLKVQAAVQPYVDNAISKTINLPSDFPFETLVEVYTQAFALGLKGCTIFRSNPITGSILETLTPEEQLDRCCPYT